MRYLMPIIFIGAAIASFFFYTNPQYQAIKAQAASYQAIVEANAKATQLRAVREKLTGDRAKIPQENIDRLLSTLPDGVENVRLIIDIDNIASEYGLRIRNTKINDLSSKSTSNTAGPDSNRYGTISMAFSVTSSYETFLQFLGDLESSQRLVDVTNLTFGATGKDDVYDFNLTIQTYWLK